MQTSQHSLTTLVGLLREQVKSVADLNPVFMPTVDKVDVLGELVALESQVAALRLRVMASAGDVAVESGDRSVAAWLSRTQRLRRSDCVADGRLAEALDRDLPVLSTALREARVNLAQARVIAAAVGELPDRVGAEVIAKAEAELVRLAADHDPKDLTVLGRRILQIVDPERFEDEERRRLQGAERQAALRQRLRLRAVGDGLTRISGVLPDAVAARLATYLHAFTNPRLAEGAVRGSADDAGTAEGEERGFGQAVNRPRRLAEAFGQLLETLDPKRLPIHGGDATNVTVTISLDALRDGLGVATLDNGVPGDGFEAITAAHARRLACNARIIPAVLGSDSEVLDLGRASRLFTKAQRRALLLRDRTCRAEGCDIPGTWSEAHHLRPWQGGGETDLHNAVLLCSHHHHRVHDPGYDHRRLASGDLRFHRRS
ncbi:DUF222 domain-containing protein [Nocardioides jishulii]|nr:HNH endonuclease signature motif containing protein [Nocardioides jishulii]QCX26573.1 DUF222 domain-containing protein [Nocardioides jishulii]